MSTSDFGGAQDLNQEEQTLHHHAAMVKKDLEAYRDRAYSRSQDDWKNLFKNLLARFILVIRFCKPFSDLSRRNQ
jgi:hypothetical protein